jgi:hypothetical protein
LISFQGARQSARPGVGNSQISRPGHELAQVVA